MTREEAIFCEKSYLGETNCTDCKYYGTDTCESRETHKMSIKALEQEPRWISISERLPEDFQRVLVTIVNYNGDKVVRVAEYSRRTFKIKENYEQWNVGEKGLLAWRPLPEPYKAESER
jgi:hypothetical protein